LKKLQSKEIQEGKVFHNAKESVRVLRIKVGEAQSPPPRLVVFQEFGNHRADKRCLLVGDFCDQYQRRKKR